MDRIEELVCQLITEVGEMNRAVLRDENKLSLQHKRNAAAIGLEIANRWRGMEMTLERYRSQTRERGKLAAITRDCATWDWRQFITPLELEAHDMAVIALAHAKEAL